jgi:hypothetical protein
MLIKSQLKVVQRLVFLWSIGGNKKDFVGPWRDDYDVILRELDQEYLDYEAIHSQVQAVKG